MNSQTILEFCPVCHKGHPKEINSYDGEIKFFCQYCLVTIKVREEGAK